MCDEFAKKLIKNISEKRFKHSLCVSETAMQLAELFGADPLKAKIAGLLHDCGRDIPGRELLRLAKEFNIMQDDVIAKAEPVLLHAPIGAKLVTIEYGIDDNEICEAIWYHTTGRAEMSVLEKVVYLADCIEPGRNYPGVERLRLLSKENLNRALLAAFEQSIGFLLSNQKLIHPESINGRNSLLLKNN